MAEEDTTLAGYLAVHNRPPAYAGSDGHPYTVSIETERTGDLTAPVSGFLVFPRWAQTGVGIVGHVETGTLVRKGTTDEAVEHLGRMTLLEVQEQLERAIRDRGDEETGDASAAVEAPDPEHP